MNYLGALLNWLISSTQFISLDKNCSDEIVSNTSVQQGPVLAPFVFISITTNCKPRMYCILLSNFR